MKAWFDGALSPSAAQGRGLASLVSEEHPLFYFIHCTSERGQDFKVASKIKIH